MTSQHQQEINAIHLGDGNYFDNIRLDIHKSHQRFKKMNRNLKSIKHPIYINYISLLLTGLLQKFHLQAFVVQNGFKRKWFEDFYDYWSTILNGRPLTIMDFFILVHDYRKRQQYVTELHWESSEMHLKNWQHPEQMYATLASVKKLALHPLLGRRLWRMMKKGTCILEYGCSAAPYYYCYRHFFSHLRCHWLLADLPNFPFHFAKYLYRHDREVDFLTIEATDFLNPLQDRDDFDVIILSNVLEHLDDPLFVSTYLLERLKPDGLLVFDYIKSDGKGLDHPQALNMREACLQTIIEKTEILYGDIDITKHVGFSIARKKV